MKYVIRVIADDSFILDDDPLYTNLKKAILNQNLNYGTFQNWKSKNKIDYPITYRGFLFEKVDVK